MNCSLQNTRCPLLPWRLVRGWLLVAMAVMAIITPGCSCREETPQERAAREQREEEAAEQRRQEEAKKQKKPPLEVQAPITQPGAEDITSLLVKPGHWQFAKQAMKPNYEDWVGEATLQVVDEQNQPIPIDRTAFTLRSSRDVALSKGQEKQVESIFYTPPAPGQLRMRSSLRERRTSLTQPPLSQKLVRMAPHQQHFVVLGKESQRYRFVASLKSIDAPLSQTFDAFDKEYELPMAKQYRVVLPPIDDRVPLPDNPLCWTSVAYLLWDEVDPERLNVAQQAALIDWIHWGGQLLVSGPDSLDLLRNSFLDPYLPADSGGARTITADDLRPLSTAWAASRRASPLKPVNEWSGIKLQLRPEAEPIAGVRDLFAERRVGRGRIVVSAMQLAERGLINWQGGFENLFNNLLLRRPPRNFRANNIEFAGDDSSAESKIYVVRGTRIDDQLDTTSNSKLRYFARDTFADEAARQYTVADAGSGPNFGGPNLAGPGAQANGGILSRKIEPPAVTGGPAAWSDFNAAAGAARESLRKAAGVNVPGSRFVVLCLAIYLAVLAPFNWFLFKALGRVELAWVAAPIIALISTWVVVKQAQLDIGFVRAQTEVAILETQPDHTRGHLTRYLSFYTSLSTTYDLEFDEPTTLAAPFARSTESTLLPGQRPAIARYQRQEKARLLGLTVSSNATDMAHTEQMLDLGGALRFDPDRRRLTNETDLAFDALAVVRRPEGDSDTNPTLQGCWIGELVGRTSTPVSFLPLISAEDADPFVDRRKPTGDDVANGAGAAADELDLEPLFALALDPRGLQPGEVRAVGRLEQVFPGVTVSPQASQLRGATFVVAHLAYGKLPTPKSDANAPIDATPRR